VSRDTIHYYISEGLLPPGQKASARRAIYDHSHVELLKEIRNLKTQGLTLKEIRDRLDDRIRAATDRGVDLVARETEAVRAAILEVAARRFAERGYEKTRVSDVCREAGVTPQVLYSNFPSKRHLFIHCYRVYYQWMREQVEPLAEQTDDLNARLALRSWASLGIQALSPDLQAMARVEVFHPESELRPLVRELYEEILRSTVRELESERLGAPGPADEEGRLEQEELLDTELVSYAFIGALESMQMRASWDGRYSRRDVMRNLLVMYMAVRGVLSGRVDVRGEWAAVARLVDSLSDNEPAGGGRSGATMRHPAPCEGLSSAGQSAFKREV